MSSTESAWSDSSSSLKCASTAFHTLSTRAMLADSTWLSRSRQKILRSMVSGRHSTSSSSSCRLRQSEPASASLCSRSYSRSSCAVATGCASTEDTACVVTAGSAAEKARDDALSVRTKWISVGLRNACDAEKMRATPDSDTAAVVALAILVLLGLRRVVAVAGNARRVGLGLEKARPWPRCAGCTRAKRR